MRSCAFRNAFPVSKSATLPRTSRQILRVLAAKKGGKKSAQKKGGSALADLLKKKEQATSGDGDNALARPDQYKDPDVVILLLSICTSYWKSTQKCVVMASNRCPHHRPHDRQCKFVCVHCLVSF